MNVETFAQALAERLPTDTKVTHAIRDGIVTFTATVQRHSNAADSTDNRPKQYSLAEVVIFDHYDPSTLLSLAASHLATPLADEVPGTAVLDSSSAGSNLPMEASPQPHPNPATDHVPSLNDETFEEANEKVRLAQIPPKVRKTVDEPARVGHVLEAAEPAITDKPRRTRVKPL